MEKFKRRLEDLAIHLTFKEWFWLFVVVISVLILLSFL